MVKFQQIGQSGTLKLVDTLIVIAHNKHIGRFPKIEQVVQQLILRPIGILVLIHQKILIPFLIIAQQGLIGFESLQHPKHHILVFIAPGALEGLLVTRIQIGSSLQTGHLFGNILDFCGLGCAFFTETAIYLVNIIGMFGQTGQKFVHFSEHKSGCPAFFFHY